MCEKFGHIGPAPITGNPSEVLRHRGPDDGGMQCFAVDGSVSVQLGHRHLAVIDLSPLGHQPMSNEGGTVWITFNGEIFNFPDLRNELLQAAYCLARVIRDLGSQHQSVMTLRAAEGTYFTFPNPDQIREFHRKGLHAI